MELKVISALMGDRNSAEQLRDVIDRDDFSQFTRRILDEVFDFYDKDPEAVNVDKDVIEQNVYRKYSRHKKAFASLFEKLTPVSIPNVVESYVELRKQAIKDKMAAIALSSGNDEELSELIEEFKKLKDVGAEALNQSDDSDNCIYIAESIDSITSSLSDDNLMKLWPPTLNDVLDGGLPRGTHVILFARPETGKSLIAIAQACYSLQQGYKVLYVGNEDPASSMLARIMCNLSGLTRQELLENKEYAMDVAIDNGYNNLIFADLHPGSVMDVKELAYKYMPDVIIVDQLRNLRTSKPLSKVEALEHIAQELRALYKEVDALGISITQAGDSAENKLVLDMGDVDFSNTGIPSTADVMIGVGVNAEYESMNQRVLSLCKNKRSATHTSFPITVNAYTSSIVA